MSADKSLTIAIDLTGVLEQYPELGAVLEQMCPSAEQDYRAWIAAVDDANKRAKRLEIVLQKIAEWGEAHGMLTHDAESQPLPSGARRAHQSSARKP